jgi:hypothetical protein
MKGKYRTLAIFVLSGVFGGRIFYLGRWIRRSIYVALIRKKGI